MRAVTIGGCNEPSTSAVCSPTAGAGRLHASGVALALTNAPGARSVRPLGRVSSSQYSRAPRWSIAITSATVFTGAIVTLRAMPPSNSSCLESRCRNTTIFSRTSSSGITRSSVVSIRASYVAQFSWAAHSAVTAPLSTIHGTMPVSVADVAISTTSPSAHG